MPTNLPHGECLRLYNGLGCRKYMRTNYLLYFLATRAQPKRWLNVLAVVLPVLLVFRLSVSVYHVFYWSYAPIVIICLWQFFKPTVAGWLVILVFYSYGFLELLGGIAREFMDYGSEDHSSWEGWFTASMEVALAIFIALIIVAVARNFPKSPTRRRCSSPG